MPTHRLRSTCLASTLAIALVGGAVGCGGGGGGSAPARLVPGFPAQQDVPVNPAHVAAARQELATQLKSDLPSDRAHAIEGLRDSAPGDAAAPVLTALDDRSPIVRFAAAFAAGELKLAGARDGLLAKLADPDARVRVGVRFALHKLGDSSRTAELEKYAQDFTTGGDAEKGRRVRGTTAMVLGRIGEPSAANLLRLMRIDGDAGVRQQAEESLFLLADDRAATTIGGLTVSANRFEQMFALRALAQRKEPKFRGVARTQLTNEFPEVATAAAMAMGAMGADDGYGVAMAGLKSKEPMQRALAAAAFGTIGRADAQDLLAAALKDKEAEVRAAAATALLTINAEPKRYTRAGDLIR